MPTSYKLAASNIAWDQVDNVKVYQRLREGGFSGLEIAPTKLIAESPYHLSSLPLASQLASSIKSSSDLAICSMQSIWYGRKESLFGSPDERSFLLEYTKKAIDFSAAIGCAHIVFGSPRNRILPPGASALDAINFFHECALHALSKGVVIGLEANPVAYGTNFLNTTPEVIEFIKLINSPAIRLNLDLGAIIENKEDPNLFSEYLKYASHIHISEPMLMPVIDRSIHEVLKNAINQSSYCGWISLEMKSCSTEELFASIEIMSNAFL